MVSHFSLLDLSLIPDRVWEYGTDVYRKHIDHGLHQGNHAKDHGLGLDDEGVDD